MLEFIWALTFAAITCLCVLLVRLSGAAKRSARQVIRLTKNLKVFLDLNQESVVTTQAFQSIDLDEALRNRKIYLTNRSKLKEAKQRRLLKRLRGLTSKESE
ncbi:MAG: hypothetical protein RIS31_846 [Actinomycetota bacterium]|jgi:hypothetical protein